MKTLMLTTALAVAVLTGTAQAEDKMVWREQVTIMAPGLDPFQWTLDDFPSAAECEKDLQGATATAEAAAVKQFGEGTHVLMRCVARIAGAVDPKIFRSQLTIIEQDGTVQRGLLGEKPGTAEECESGNAITKPDIAAKVAKKYPGATFFVECVRISG